MQFKNNTKQRSASIQGLRSFKDTLPKEAKRILVKKGEIYNKTLDNWKYFVGENLFKVCYPKSFKGSNKIRGSSIDIMVRRGNEVDLEYEKKNIISKINAYFGYQVVKFIKIITFEGKLEKNKVKKAINATKKNQIKKINNIKNIKIKSSLLELSKLYRK